MRNHKTGCNRCSRRICCCPRPATSCICPPGPPGPPGLPGSNGDPGPAGPPGSNAPVFDLSYISAYNTTPTPYVLNDILTFPNVHVAKSMTSAGAAFLVDNPGVYEIEVSINASQPSGPTPALAAVQIRRNGSVVPGSFTTSAVASNADAVSGTIAILLALDAGDAIDVQNAGGAITINSANLVIAPVDPAAA